jgi:hypothetical protein
MSIILLSGQPNTGKTTTINLVYDELIRQGALVKKKKKQLGNNKMDFECVLEYQNKIIAIYSMGDDHRLCERAVKTYRNCNFLILAYSAKKTSQCKLYNATAKDTMNLIINKTVDNTDEAKMEKANKKDSTTILSSIIK